MPTNKVLKLITNQTPKQNWALIVIKILIYPLQVG